MEYRAVARLCLGEHARPVYSSLRAEVLQGGPRKGEVSVGIVNGCVEIRVSSNELSGLRALLNSYLLLLHAAYSALDSVSKR